MHVRDVGAADVDGHRDLQPARGTEEAHARELRTRAREMRDDGLSEPELLSCALVDRLVQLLSGLLCHAEPARAEDGIDILRRRAAERHLEIVNEYGAIHRERGDIPALHEIDQHRRQACLDDVRAESPDEPMPACRRRACARRPRGNLRRPARSAAMQSTLRRRSPDPTPAPDRARAPCSGDRPADTCGRSRDRTPRRGRACDMLTATCGLLDHQHRIPVAVEPKPAETSVTQAARISSCRRRRDEHEDDDFGR